jgi:hypothetical protein
MTEERDPIAQRLESERPVPTPAFRGELRRHLIADASERSSEPPRLLLLIGAYAGCGVVLLAIVVIGIAGVGPLAA